MATLNDILGNRNILNAPSLNNTQSLPAKINYVQNLGNANLSQGINPASNGASNGGGGGGGGGGGFPPPPQQQPQGDQRSEQQKYEDSVRDSINSGYDSYFGYLDELMGGLPGQAQNQDQVIQNTTNQNLSDLQASTDSSKADLTSQGRKIDENQTKNLRDLSDNIINQGLAGSIYLGAKGAGDSSASNMYSYALQKMGNKQRGDIVAASDSYRNDIADRESKVNNIYTQEKSRINTDSQNQLLGVAQWLATQQNAVKQAKATGQLDKGKDLGQLSSQLLAQATQKAQQIYNDAQSRSSALESWAMNNSKNIGELKSNLSSLGQTNYALPQASNLVSTPSVDSTGNISAAPIGLGYGGNTQKKDAFGNVIAA